MMTVAWLDDSVVATFGDGDTGGFLVDDRLVLAANAAVNACTARLFTAREYQRAALWINVIASSENNGSARPAILAVMCDVVGGIGW